ncbi:SOS-response transcriptional repressor LexA [Chthoniobacter flavus]|nr:SOS-response transcriptional repressor LexA [Chthoniobacter flavus]
MAPKLQTRLTAPQLRVARVLATWEREGKPAFVPELARASRYSTPSGLMETLQRMKRNGFVEILGGGAKGRPRLVKLTPKGRLAVGSGGLPVLGEIPAGPLAATLAEPVEIMEDENLLSWRAGDFLLRVKGDSMIGDGILPGDYALLRPDIHCDQGEIAAVHARDDYEGTLKHVFVEKDQVRLKASNPEYDDIIVSSHEWRGVAGVFRGLVRRANRS